MLANPVFPSTESHIRLFLLGGRIGLWHAGGMKSVLPALLLAALAHTALADPLSDSDRRRLLDKLKTIEDTAHERIEERFHRAVRDYTAAMRSEDEALELYINCVEKVDFEEKHREGSEFREWKRRQENELEDPGFSLALRYQLRWLTLVLKSASRGADRAEISKEAFEQLTTIYRDIEKVQNQKRILGQSVTASVYARAYGIHHTESYLPLSPTAVSQIYEEVILPPLREGRMIAGLKTAWQRRIQLEEIDATGWAVHDTRVFRGDKRDRDREREARDRNRDEKRIKEETFVTETRPDLLWAMEVDLFRAGDESGAASRMINHVNTYLTHKNSTKWVKELQGLLDGGEEATESEADSGIGP